MIYRFDDHTLEQSHPIEAGRWDTEGALRKGFELCRLAWDVPDNAQPMARVTKVQRIADNCILVEAIYEDNRQVYMLWRG